MINMQPFSFTSKTLDVSVTSTASASGALPGQGNSLRIVNEGPNIAFVSVGSGAQVATLPSSVTPVATCTPVPPGDYVFTLPGDAIYNVSAVCRASQTARLSIQVGEGF